MMDGYTIEAGQRRPVVFISALQAQSYGGYAAAAKVYGAAVILPPSLLDDFHADLSTVHEVGHA